MTRIYDNRHLHMFFWEDIVQEEFQFRVNSMSTDNYDKSDKSMTDVPESVLITLISHTNML